MKTTVAIINWNSGALLKSCVESLVATAPDVQLLIIDNHSNDGSVAFLDKLRERIQLIDNPGNRGFAGGVNDAVSHSSSTPYVLILNPDVRALPGSVKLLEELMDRHPRAGAIGGYVGEKYLPRHFPTPGSLVLENLGLGASISAGAVYDRASASISRVDQVAAAALMIRREAHEDVGRFDEQFYPAWYEDVDFCRRLKRDDWEVYFALNAKFPHSGGYSAKTMGGGRFVYAYYRNQMRYAGKWFAWYEVIIIRASVVLGAIGRMVARPSHSLGYAKVLFGALIAW